MLASVQAYNQLHQNKTSREKIQSIIEDLKKDEQYYFANVLTNALKNSDKEYFQFNIENKCFEVPQIGLLGSLECIDNDEDFTGLNKAVHQMIYIK